MQHASSPHSWIKTAPMTLRALSAFSARRLGARAIVAAVLALTVSACDPDVHTRGNLPTASKISEIKVGSTTRSQVESLLGTPSTTSLFDQDETWLYIGSHTQQVAYKEMEELDRQVIAISFDQSGVVSNMRNLSKEDGSDLTLVDRKTPTAGNELSLVEQLLGNVGRFSNENTGGKGVTRK